MDEIDRKILRILQADATLPIAAIADRVGLSQTPCWKRIRRLELEGTIRKRVALVAPERVGLGLTAFVAIELGEHSEDAITRFTEQVMAMEDVLDFYRMAGDVDYMLRVVVRDMPAFDAFYKRLITGISLKKITSRFALERVKWETAVPITSS